MSAPPPEQFYPLLQDNIGDPYPLYRRYREAGPLHRIANLDTGREPEWLVFGYAAAAAVLAGRGFGRRAAAAYRGSGPAPALIPADFPHLARLVENWLVFMDPPRHTGLRSTIAECFAARLDQDRLLPAVDRIAGELAGTVADRPVVELVGDFAAPLPMLVILEVLGTPRADRDMLRECALALQNGSSFRPGDRAARLAAAEKAAAELDSYFRGQVRQRRRHGGDDLVARLSRAQTPGPPLTEDELVGTCSHLLTAGHEAAANAIAKGSLTLLRHPGLLDHLRRRPELTGAAVDELIRFDAPVQLVTRWAYQDHRVAGRDIGRGDKVTVALGAANRDPARFADPDAVRFDRADHRHCGFGMGTHYCLGSPLGRRQVQAGLAALLDLLPRLDVAEEPVPYARDVVFHGPQRLLLRRRQRPSI